MDRTDAPTGSYGSRAQFEREKERLIVEINQGMDIVNRYLLQLNQNLESAISLGSNFGRIASLWSEFGAIINPPMEEDVGSGLNVGQGDDSIIDGDDEAGGDPSNDNDDDHPGYQDGSLMDEDP
ncbi:Dolichyl-diphosphooligosaccharide-protein glycosyltransferase subunit dad1 [Coemansia spiralis]|uniref:DASH complex subunit DAD1 n=1 Tax=Coemansia spiralis TaxID=417178 RepID=A0A9W8L022_9FUNG|nr:Dolichyl-diphosphooligosaccharide-protein glycosyltransferase subunit dad1 [Coemansia sp. S85]KAJ2682017.1 Dolichyl-diphosphooligosaccharide-protein glycosyltransferase subunit dad1 [Coemansia spiralis]